MGWYKKQFENDLDARNENKEEQVARHDPFSGLWTRMFLDNLKLLFTLLPFLFLHNQCYILYYLERQHMF